MINYKNRENIDGIMKNQIDQNQNQRKRNQQPTKKLKKNITTISNNKIVTSDK